MSYDYISNPEESKELLPRYRLFYIAILLSFMLFTSRLWYLQIIEGAALRDFSEKNRIKQTKIIAPRGLIFDREDKILVENHPGFEAVLTPYYIKELEATAQKVGKIINIPAERIIQRVQRSRRQNGVFAPVKVKGDLTRDEVFRLKHIRLETPGLDIQEIIVRYYPMDYNGAQLLGYVSEISKRQLPTYNKMYEGQIQFEQGDLIGKTGLEELLEREIRGKDGVQYIQVDAFGRETSSSSPDIYGQEIKNMEPSPGYNAILTIDRDIQEAAWKTLQSHERIGALVALKTNGEVLAWASSPSFDPNAFPRGISNELWSKYINDPFRPLRNKVIQDHFAPGSTFKPFMALAALEEKVITPSTIIHSPGALTFGRRQYHDHLRGGHGNINVYEAIERSSNVFFYKMGIQLGIDKMHAYVAPFGIGSRTGIELPREVTGRMPSSEWKKSFIGEPWQPGESLTAAVGQGFVESNVLQMAVAYNAIGTEGKVVRPFIVKKIVDNDNNVIRTVEPEVLRDLTEMQKTGVQIKPESFKVVKEALRRVVQGNRGTAVRLRIPGVEMAGKTGTAQVMAFSADQIYVKCDTRPIRQRHHGWFVAFAPADNPEITVAALAEHSCSGSGGAGPLVRDVMLAYFQKHHPELIAEGLKNVRIRHVPAPVQTPEED